MGDVRFAPESGHVRCKQECPLRARSGHYELLGERFNLSDLTPVFGREHVRIEVGNPLLPFLGDAEIA